MKMNMNIKTTSETGIKAKTNCETETLMSILVYASCVVFAIGIFLSVTVSALGHICLLIPGIYFFVKKWQEWRNSPHLDSQQSPFPLSASALCLLGLVIVGILSIMVNHDVSGPLRKILKLKYFLIGVLGIGALEKSFESYIIDLPKKRFLIHLFLVSTTLATLSGLIGLVSGFSPLRMGKACHATRACGNFGMYMTYGYGIQFFMVLVVGLIIFRKQLAAYCRKDILYASAVVNLAGLFLAYARGAWIGFLLALPFFFFRKNKKFFILTGIIITLIGTALYQKNEKVRDIFQNSQRVESNKIRLSQYKAAYFAFKERPWFGMGHRNFEPHSGEIKAKYHIEYPEFSGHAHNNFIEQLASTGITGLLLLILFHFFWLKECYQRKDVFGDMTISLIVALLVSGQFQYTLGDGENLFLLMMVYSLSQIPRREIDA